MLYMQADEAPASRQARDSSGSIMEQYMQDSQRQLAAVHGAGLTDAEVQRTKQGLQDDVVMVRVGHSVQSVYVREESESSTARAHEPGACSNTGSEEHVCNAEQLDSQQGESEQAQLRADDVNGFSDDDYYDAYMNSTAEGGMEYYDDYFMPVDA